MKINTGKTKNMILFFVTQIKNVTSIKLQKAMLLADRIHWAKYKTSISGLEYVKGEYGPVMEKKGWRILSSMDNTDLNVKYEYSRDCVKTIRTSTLEPCMNIFSDTELEALHDSYDIVNTKTTKQLSEMTHDEAWKNAKFGDVLPYESCIHDEIIDENLNLSDDDKKVIIEAIESRNYSQFEEIAKAWN